MRKTLSGCLIIFSVSASAIVIRHDVADEKYLADATDFAPLAKLYLDGAHGTLIKPDWVLTAAHATFCLHSGRYISLNNNYHKVERIFVHSDYQPGKSHDIALIKLAAAVVGVTPAELYKEADESGKVSWFMGTGGTGNGLTGQSIDNSANAGVLRKAENKIEQAEGPVLTFKFDRDEQALPYEGVSGGGDSGGPAYITIRGKHYLLGISSRVEGGSIGQYGVTEVYSRVSFFTAWIEQVMAAEQGSKLSIAKPKLDQLPAGLTEQGLAEVCADIGLQPHSNQ
mgnify:CR=1 FL=1